MNSLALFVLACVCLTALTSVSGPDAPLWPQTFSQEFVEGDSKTKVYTTGKLWYDIKNNRQRFDSTSSVFDQICQIVGKDNNASCIQLNVNKILYIHLPDKRLCCKLCTAAQGCIIQPRDWLKDYKYVGEATLSGQSFYKWTYTTSQYSESYYATQDAQRVPRRIDSGTFGLDFIMNTYSKDSIADSVFQVPNYCNSVCPRGSYEQVQNGNRKYSLRDVLFRKTSDSKQQSLLTEQ